MATLHQILHNLKAVVLFLGFFLVLLPYYILEAIVSHFTNNKPKSVKNEIVLITGTGHGIGKLLAIKYAQQGAKIVAWDIDEKLNNETVAHIKKLGYQNVHGYKVDVSNRENVMEVAKKVQQDVGDVTILINNAGIMPSHSFLEHTEKEIRRIMDINVMGNFWTLQAFLPAMRRNNHGHVVALSSMAGLLGLVNLVPYNASKFAVRGLMEGLYEEFRRYPNNKVHFTTIYPFMVDTGLCKNVEITYPDIIPMLKPEYVAEKIFESQVYNKRNVAVPPDVNVIVSLKTKYLPEKASNFITDHFKADVLSDLEVQINGHSSKTN